MFRLRLRALVVLFTLWRRLPPLYRRLALRLVRRHGMKVLGLLWVLVRRRASRRLSALRRR